MSSSTVAPIFARGAGVDFSKAVETEYSNIRFRSRFEANTAFLLDVLGLAWEYEPTSFLLPNGSHYRPDFWIPEVCLWLECRGYRTDEGDRQIRAFGRMIRQGEIDSDGATRPPTAWDERNLMWRPRYTEASSPDFLVLRSDEECEWWEYVGRPTSRSKPTESSVDLSLCSKCSAWFFSGGGYVIQCRQCLRIVLFSDLSVISSVLIEASRIIFWDMPLAENGIDSVAEWAEKHGLRASEGPPL